jgi:hypothetical protein
MFIHQALHGNADMMLNLSSISNHGKFLEGVKTEADKEREMEGRETQFIQVCCDQIINRCLSIIQEGVYLVAVLDGMTPPLKKGTTTKRREDGEVAIGRIDELPSVGGKVGSSTSSSNSSSPPPPNLTIFPNQQSINYKSIRKAGGTSESKKKLHLTLLSKLREHSIPFVVSQYEADSELAFLSNTYETTERSPEGGDKEEDEDDKQRRPPKKKGGRRRRLADVIITDDSDAIPYSIPRVLFKFDIELYGMQYNRSDLPLIEAGSSNLNFDSFTNVMVSCFATLSGCDYLPSLPKVGLVTAMTLVRDAFGPYMIGNDSGDDDKSNSSSRSPLRRLFDSLRRGPYCKLLTPSGIAKYEVDFMRALALFRRPVVYDTRSQGQGEDNLDGGVALIMDNNDHELMLYQPYSEIVTNHQTLQSICGGILPPPIARAVSEGWICPMLMAVGRYLTVRTLQPPLMSSYKSTNG